MAEPLESLTLRLSFDDKLSAEIRAAAAVLTAQGRGMAQAIQPVQEALVRLDKDGRASLERLAVGAQESAAQVAKSAAGIDKALDGIGGQGKLDTSLAQGAQGLSLLDAGATKLLGTLSGLAAGFFTLSKATQLLREGSERNRAFEEQFRDLPLKLGLASDAVKALDTDIRRLAEVRGLPVLDALSAVETAVDNGAGTAVEALQTASAALDLYTVGLARAGDATKVVTDALSAYGRGSEDAAKFTSLIGGSLLATRDNAQQFAAGLDRILPKAVRVGAGLEGLLNLYGQLRAAGLPLQASLANVERSLDQLAEVDTQRYFANLGADVSRAAIELRGIDAVVGDLARSFAGNADVTSEFSSRGVGIGAALDVIDRSGKSAASSLDELTEAQRRFIQAAKDGQESAATLAKQIDVSFDNLIDKATKFGKEAVVGLALDLEALAASLAKLGGNANAQGFQLFDRGTDPQLASLIASADEFERSLGRVRLALRQAEAELAKLDGETLGQSGAVAEERAKRRLELERTIGALRIADEQALAKLEDARAAKSAARAADAAEGAGSAAGVNFSESFVESLRFDGLRESALRAINAIKIPPLSVDVEVSPLPESVTTAASKLLQFASKASNPGDEAQAQAREYLAIVERFTDAQASSEQLLAQLRARSLEGLQRQTAESQILLAGIEKQIAAIQEEGVAVDALRAAFRDLGAAEAKRLQDAAAAQAKQIADQRAALGEKLNALGSSTATGLDAQFRAVEDRIRSFTREVDRARETASAAGQKGLIDEGQLASATAALDELAAGAIRVQSALKAAESEKFGQEFAKSLQEIDAAIAGLGRGLQSGLDAEFAQIDAETRAVLDRIQKARDEADAARDALSRSGLPTDLIPDTSALDAAAAKALLLGDALKFSAQTEQAREFQSVLADIGRDVQQAAAAGLPEVTREFAQAAIDLRAAQADAQRRIEDAVARGLVDPADAKRLVENSLSAIQREFDAKAGELTLEFVLRPSLQIEEERLRRELEAKLRPFALKIEAATAERDASLNPETGQYDPDKVRAVEEALNAARLAAEAFNKELLEGAGALGEGFSAGLSDRINAATNDFVTGAKLASTAFDALGGSLGDAFYSIVEGSKSASEAFKDFVRSFVAQIAQAISQALAFRLVAGSIGFLGFGGPATLGGLPNGGVGFAAEGGVFPGQMLEPFRFAEGGIMPGSMQAAQSILHEGRRLPVMNYAVGGVARTPQAAIFAEKPGMAEAFVPLPGPDRGIPVEFRNLPDRGRREPVEPAGPTTVAVSVNYQISALDAAGVREMLVREARTIEDVIASAVSSGTNRGLTESVRSAGNPARG